MIIVNDDIDELLEEMHKRDEFYVLFVIKDGINETYYINSDKHGGNKRD